MAKNYRCKLLPYEKSVCLSIQDAKQKAGWAITAFDLPKAWSYTQGEGVVIAVLDSGVDLAHEDLKHNLLPGINFVKPGQPPEDDNLHGTHCAGILVAENNDVGMVGVCPKAKVIPVKVLDSKGNGNLLNVAEGVRWAADNGADLITMSLGAPMKVQQVRKAIQYAASKSVVTFCAAGNAGDKENIFYPANYPECISISAIDENMNIANFSNLAKNLDFLAPGVDIFSTVPKNWYATLSGSSMACPFAVGVAALLLSHVRKGKSNISLENANDYRKILKQYTTVSANNIYDGFGIIDPRKFLDAID